MVNADDFAKITQLMTRYALALDQRDVAALSMCYAQNVELIIPGMPTLSGPGVSKDQLQRIKDTSRKTLHRVFNIIFDMKGDILEGETYCSALYLIKADDTPTPVGVGSPIAIEWLIRYQDQLVKQGNDWRIARRETIVDWKEQRSGYDDLPRGSGYVELPPA